MRRPLCAGCGIEPARFVIASFAEARSWPPPFQRSCDGSLLLVGHWRQDHVGQLVNFGYEFSACHDDGLPFLGFSAVSAASSIIRTSWVSWRSLSVKSHALGVRAEAIGLLSVTICIVRSFGYLAGYLWRNLS